MPRGSGPPLPLRVLLHIVVCCVSVTGLLVALDPASPAARFVGESSDSTCRAVTRLPTHPREDTSVLDDIWADPGDSDVWFQRMDRAARVVWAQRGVWPITFALSRSLMPPAASWPKSKALAGVVPGDFTTYVFNTTESYLAEYGRSVFGLTHRKGGWDCVRHAEILASGSLPLMPDAASIPPLTMVFHPKHLYRSLLARPYIQPPTADRLAAPASPLDQAQYRPLRYSVAPAADALADSSLATATRAALAHAHHVLNAEVLARYMLRITGHADARRVLFVASPSVDHLADLLYIGFRNLPELALVYDCPVLNFTYTSFPRGRESIHAHRLYGAGISYGWQVADPRLRARSFATATALLRAGFFDVAVFASGWREQRLLREALVWLPPDRVLFVDGEDGDDRVPGWRRVPDDVDPGIHVFKRELGP